MTEWRAFFAGDVFLGGNPEAAWVSDELVHLMRAHDIVSCNFEAPIVVPGMNPCGKVGSWLAHPPEAAQRVLETGFNVVHLANNHLCDYDEPGVAATLSAFKGVTVLGAGLDFGSTYALIVKAVKGVRVGLLGYGEAEFGAWIERNGIGAGYAWINNVEVDRTVGQAKQAVDVLLVQVHAGVEEVDLPLPEWRQRYHRLIELGADAVIAHHPHVPQGWEIMDGRPVFYSLGNFRFVGESASPQWNNGYAVSLTFRGAAFSGFEVVPLENTTRGVALNHDPEYRQYLQRLCRSLEEPEYGRRIDSQALELWSKRYWRFYRTAVLGLAWERMRAWVPGAFGRRKSTGGLLLLHNLQSESHLWTAQRALRILTSRRMYA